MSTRARGADRDHLRDDVRFGKTGDLGEDEAAGLGAGRGVGGVDGECPGRLSGDQREEEGDEDEGEHRTGRREHDEGMRQTSVGGESEKELTSESVPQHLRIEQHSLVSVGK